MRHVMPLNKLSLLIVSVALGGCVAASTQQVSDTIPLEFQGEWSLDTAYCGHEGDDLDHRIFVDRKQVGYFESVYQVATVERDGNVLTVSYEPRGHAYISPVEYLRLSPDGDWLFTSDNPNATGFARCP